MVIPKHLTFSESGPPLTESDVRAFEKRQRLKLPAAYQEFLLAANGGRPSQSALTLPLEGQHKTWAVHFFFGLNDPETSCNLDWNLEVTKRTRPPGTIPIANDAFGNLFYLAVTSPREGAVFFGPTPTDGHTVDPTFVSPTLSAFLHSLIP